MKKRLQNKKVKTLLAASGMAAAAFVSINPAEASTVQVNGLVKKAQLSSSSLKKYYDVKSDQELKVTQEFLQAYNNAGKDIESAQKAVNQLKGTQKNKLQQQLETAANNRLRAGRLIDAIKVGENLTANTSALNLFITKDKIDEEMVETYHSQSESIRKTERIFGKVYGAETRKALEKKYLVSAKIAKESVKYEVSRFLLQEQIELLIQEERISEAKLEASMLDRLEERAKTIKEQGNKLYPGKYPALNKMNNALIVEKERLIDQFVIKLTAESKDPLKPTVFGNDGKIKTINRDIIIFAGTDTYIELRNLEINGNVTIKGANGTEGNISLTGVKVNGTISVEQATKTSFNQVVSKLLVVEDGGVEVVNTSSQGKSALAVTDEGTEVNLDKSAIDKIIIKKRLRLHVESGNSVGEIAINPVNPSQQITLSGDLSASAVSVDGNSPNVELSNDAKLTELQFKSPGTLNAGSGAVVESILMNGDIKDTLRVHGKLPLTSITIQGQENEVIIDSEASLKAVVFENTGSINVGKGAEIPSITVAPSNQGALVTLQGDLSKSTVGINNNNAKIIIPENTVIKEVKKDPSVTGPVEIDNRGKVETSTGVAIPNPGNSSVISSPGDTTAPAAPTVNDVDDNDTVVTGTAERGSTVSVKRGNAVLGTATANTNTGLYSVTIASQTAGEILSVTATDAAGNTSSRSSVTVTDKTNSAAFTAAEYDGETKSIKLTGLQNVEENSNFDLQKLVYKDMETPLRGIRHVQNEHILSGTYSRVNAFNELDEAGEYYYNSVDGVLTIKLVDSDEQGIQNLAGFDYKGIVTDTITALEGWNTDGHHNRAPEVAQKDVAVTLSELQKALLAVNSATDSNMKAVLEQYAGVLNLDMNPSSSYKNLNNGPTSPNRPNYGEFNRENGVALDIYYSRPSSGYTTDSVKEAFDRSVVSRVVNRDVMLELYQAMNQPTSTAERIDAIKAVIDNNFYTDIINDLTNAQPIYSHQADKEIETLVGPNGDYQKTWNSYDALTPDEKKTVSGIVLGVNDLNHRSWNSIHRTIKAAIEAQKAINELESATSDGKDLSIGTADDIAANQALVNAQTAVNKLADGTDKTNLQARIDAANNYIIAARNAETLIVAFENSVTEDKNLVKGTLDREAADANLDAIIFPDITMGTLTSLMDRMATAAGKINAADSAEAAVKALESSVTDDKNLLLGTTDRTAANVALNAVDYTGTNHATQAVLSARVQACNTYMSAADQFEALVAAFEASVGDGKNLAEGTADRTAALAAQSAVVTYTGTTTATKNALAARIAAESEKLQLIIQSVPNVNIQLHHDKVDNTDDLIIANIDLNGTPRKENIGGLVNVKENSLNQTLNYDSITDTFEVLNNNSTLLGRIEIASTNSALVSISEDSQGVRLNVADAADENSVVNIDFKLKKGSSVIGTVSIPVQFISSNITPEAP